MQVQFDNYKKLIERFEQIIYDNIAIKLAALKGFSENLNSDYDKSIKSFPLIIFVVESLLVDSVLTVNKIVEDNSDRTIKYLLNFADKNLAILKDRFPKLTEELLLKHKTELKGLEATIKRLKTQRDKYYAHSDKEYFLEPGRIATDFPNTYNDLIDVLRTLQGIISEHMLVTEGSVRICISDFVYVNAHRTVDLLKSASEDWHKKYRSPSHY
jgi:hypothetical protein